MKIVLCIFTFVSFLSCQPKALQQKKVNQIEGTAKIELLQDFHNFGILQAGETVAFSFKFKNSGTAPLFIEKIETDCGCIHTKFSKELIKCGESDFIEVVFNSAGETGKVYKRISVSSNAENRKTELAIASTVNNELINLYNTN